ncbi:RmlC-like cupin [Aureobasidium sp. EXF-10728]|nr:RmlC-like cupin [Aureobasidium sp. EXF-10728]
MWSVLPRKKSATSPRLHQARPLTPPQEEPKTTPQQQAVVLDANYTSQTQPESFPDKSRGDVTWHTLLSSDKTASQDMSAGIASCPANTGYLAHHRHTQSEIYYIISGKAEVTVDGNVHAVTGGSTVFIPGDAEHGIRNTGEQELKWFYVFPTASFGNIEYRFSEVEKVDERVDELVSRKEPPVLKIYGWDS